MSKMESKKRIQSKKEEIKVNQRSERRRCGKSKPCAIDGKPPRGKGRPLAKPIKSRSRKKTISGKLEKYGRSYANGDIKHSCTNRSRKKASGIIKRASSSEKKKQRIRTRDDEIKKCE